MTYTDMLVAGLLFLWIVCSVYVYGSNLIHFSNRATERCQRNSLSIEKTTIIRGLAILGIFFCHIGTHVNSLSSDSGTVEKLLYYGVVSLGDIGVTIFFFLSGYGNKISLQHKKSSREVIVWFRKRTVNLIGVFLLCYLLTICADMLIWGYRPNLLDCVKDIFTLSMPMATTWYLKIQFLFYVITFVGVLINKKRASLFILALTLLYSGVMRWNGADVFWWQTSFCYVIGYIFADKENYILRIGEKLSQRVFFVSSFFIFIIGLFVGIFISRNNYLLSIISYSIVGLSIALMSYGSNLPKIKSANAILKFCGKNSLEIYLLHAGIIAFALSDTESPYLLNVFIFILSTVVLVSVAIMLKYLVRKKSETR